MRHVRRLCLVLTFAIVIADPSLLFADGACCTGFENHCTSFCGDYGGVFLTNCSTVSCSDVCFCNEIDPSTQQHYTDYHSPAWCGGCEG